MIMLWYLDGDSSMQLRDRKLEPVLKGFQLYAINYSNTQDLENISEMFWRKELGINDRVWDALMYDFNRFINQAKLMKPCKYSNGNYSIECIEDFNVYIV